jgi:beta-hydroxylase
MYNHEVWNETDEDRYILLIQVKRPCSGLGNLVQNAFLFGVRHTRFVQDIVQTIADGGRKSPAALEAEGPEEGSAGAGADTQRAA